jgi:hypothetical protein
VTLGKEFDMQQPFSNIPEEPQEAQAHHFLTTLYGDDALGWLTIWLSPTKHTQWFRATNLGNAAAYAIKQAQQCDVYLGVGLRGERLNKGRGEAKDVVALPALYIDIDTKHPVHKHDNLPASTEEALALVDQAIPLPPSVIVDSGHGLHVYWLFRELWRFDSDDERRAAHHLNFRLQATLRTTAELHGWHVDGTADLARVLRLPDTINRGDRHDPKPVRVLEVYPDRRYNPSDFDPYLIEQGVGSHQAPGPSEPWPNELPHIDIRDLNLTATTKFLIVTGSHPQGKRHPSRSEAEWRAINELIAAGYDDVLIAAVLLDPAYCISEKPREKGRKWVEQEITRARAKTTGGSTSANVDDLSNTSTSDDQQPQQPPPPQAQSTPDDILPPYVLKGYTLYYRKPGTTDDQRLCNFVAWIREERTEDDGAELRRIVGMEAAIQGGKSFDDISVPISDFYSLAGILKALGTEAVVSPGPLVKDRIRHAIQLYSQRRGYPQRQVFTHLGWRKIDGVWLYLHAGGSIPAKVEVSPEKALERYALPDVSSPQAAIQASLRVLACAPLRITVPLLSMVYLAPLSQWLKPDFTEWLEGPSGARKSTLAALVMSHYGTFDRVHPPDNWESTANELEYLAFLAKDAVLWVDDYAPRHTAKDTQEQERRAQRLIRAQGNLSGRARMRSDMSLRPAYYPRGIILTTGELHPSGTSTFARILQLEIGPDDADLKALAALQAEAPLLAEAMGVYIAWLQPQLETLVPALKARWLELRAAAVSELTHHTRQPEVFAHLALAWELFLGFACEMGVLSDEERQERRGAGLEALTEAINRQRLDAEAEDPAHRSVT